MLNAKWNMNTSPHLPISLFPHLRPGQAPGVEGAYQSQFLSFVKSCRRAVVPSCIRAVVCPGNSLHHSFIGSPFIMHQLSYTI